MSKISSWLEPEMEAFLVFQASLGYQRQSYEPQLRSFANYVSENHPGEKAFSRELVMDYLDHQNAGLHRKASVLRLFARYLNAIGKDAYVLPEDMFRNPRADSPYIFSDYELGALFSAIDHLDPKKGWMSSVAPVLFRLIYTCGLRPREGRELKRECINFETGEIRILKSKGKKDRTIVMSDDMLLLCRTFDNQRAAAGIRGDYFFAKPDGEPFAEATLNRTFITCWKKAAGLPSSAPHPRNVRVYCLRHRFATAVIHRWIDEKKDLRNKLPYLQEYMGHTWLTETAYYVHLLPENLVSSAGIDWDSFDGMIPEVWR